MNLAYIEHFGGIFRVDDNYKHPVNERKMRFRGNLFGIKKENKSWIIIITVISFILSGSLSLISNNVLRHVDILAAFLIVFLIILLGIIFDIIGIAVTAADESPFHAMASRKFYGAKQAIMLIRNANKVSSLCNDVVGDICGVISGSASAFIILRIAENSQLFNTVVLGLIISGIVASLTIGGKAIGKTIAIDNSNYIIYKVAVIIKFVTVRIGSKKKGKRKNKRNL